MDLKSLPRNIRFYVLLFSLVLSLAIFLYVKFTVPGEGLQIIKLTQYYALTAVVFLYFALLPDGLAASFPKFPFRAKYTKARRAIGVSAFYFAFLHANFAFFGSLGGFAGLFYLNFNYLLAITLSFSSLVILAIMAFTSFDYWVTRLTFPRWKMIHRFVYLASLFIIIHALMLGSHFTDLSALIPEIFTAALVVLLLLEAVRLDKKIEQKFFPPESNKVYPKFGFWTILVVSASTFYLIYPFLVEKGIISLGIHSQHIQIAKENQQSATTTSNPTNPALQGNRALRYNVNFSHPNPVLVNTPAGLYFDINFASNGAPEFLFNYLYTRSMHLIIVDEQLNYFSHLHPEQSQNIFFISTKFPHPGRYYIYTNFQPLGAIEQQFGFNLEVAGQTVGNQNPPAPNFDLTQVFDGVKVKIEPDDLSAAKINDGTQKIIFTLTDDKTGEPIKNLKPYLAAFGHLVMIDVESFDYIHVHPTNLIPPQPDDNGGSQVEFLPLGLYAPIQPGVYKVFAEFNPGGKLMVADFIVEVGP